MREREIDGFIIRATTAPEELGAPFYEPAFRLKPVGASVWHEHISYAESQDTISRTQEEALAIAEHELDEVTGIHWQGDRWGTIP